MLIKSWAVLSVLGLLPLLYETVMWSVHTGVHNDFKMGRNPLPIKKGKPLIFYCFMLFHLQNSAAGHCTKFVLVLHKTSLFWLRERVKLNFFKSSYWVV